MTLYAADVMDLAKPVETKKSRAKKKSDIPTPPVSEPEEKPVQEKPKRVLTEKQKEAFEKARETRKRKREEAAAAKALEEEEIKKKQEEIAAKEAEIVAKKEAAKEKRRLAREAKKEKSLEKEIDMEVDKVVKKQKQSIATNTEHTPPAWFQKYVEGVKKEQARHEKEKKPVKQIQQEASEVAQSKWDDGLTRDRLRNEVDGHMNRMYSMIFTGRNLR